MIKRLQDGQSSTPAGALTRYLRILSKNFGIGLSAFFLSARRFRPSEPPIIAGFSASSTPRFEVRLRRFSLRPEGFPSKRAAYYGSLFVAVNTLFRGSCRRFVVAVTGVAGAVKRGSEF